MSVFCFPHFLPEVLNLLGCESASALSGGCGQLEAELLCQRQCLRPALRRPLPCRCRKRPEGCRSLPLGRAGPSHAGAGRDRRGAGPSPGAERPFCPTHSGLVPCVASLSVIRLDSACCLKLRQWCSSANYLNNSENTPKLAKEKKEI